MAKMFKFVLNNKNKIEIKQGTKLIDIVNEHYKEHPSKIMALKLDNNLQELNYELSQDVNKIEIIDMNNKDGIRIYQRSLVFVFIRAIKELYGEDRAIIKHSLSKGLYCEIGKEVSEEEVKKIEDKMREIISLNEKFVKTIIPKNEAIEKYLKLGLKDKANLLKYREENTVNIYKLGNMMDYYYGYMAYNAGILDVFELKSYGKGIIIRHPTEYSNGKLPAFEEHKKLYKTHKETEEWAEILGISYVRNINDLIKNNDITNTILTIEALQEKKIIKIADQILKNNKRIILIAGPSSSGKTTFANRLKIQLAVNGLRPVTISVDDYFVNREDTPRDEEGKIDFENLDAIDRHQFNLDIKSLLEGKETNLPKFDFKIGRRKKETNLLKVSNDQPIIIEGIHCLNPKFSEDIDDKYKFKIYISCLTQLNIDEHNRIPTTDSRLIRRMVRDHYHRGADALRTLELWSSVRRGEEKNIFPFQETADAQFNSASVYELACLKKHVEPILKQVPENLAETSEAKRMLKFLSYVVSLEDESIIPNTAIIREFIGGNIFREK